MSTSTPTSMWVSYLLASSSPWPAPMHPGGRYCIRYTSMHHDYVRRVFENQDEHAKNAPSISKKVSKFKETGLNVRDSSPWGVSG